MVLDGVSVDDRVVRRLAGVIERPLAHKLEQALFFSAEIVALTPQERTAVLAAFEPRWMSEMNNVLSFRTELSCCAAIMRASSSGYAFCLRETRLVFQEDDINIASPVPPLKSALQNCTSLRIHAKRHDHE